MLLSFSAREQTPQNCLQPSAPRRGPARTLPRTGVLGSLPDIPHFHPHSPLLPTAAPLEGLDLRPPATPDVEVLVRRLQWRTRGLSLPNRTGDITRGIAADAADLVHAELHKRHFRQSFPASDGSKWGRVG